MPFPPIMLYIIIAGLICNAITGTGWFLSVQALKAYKISVAEEKIKDQERIVGIIKHANEINSSLITRVSKQDSELLAIKEEKTNEVKKFTTNTKCLNSSTVSVLNRSNETSGSGMRSPRSQPISEDGRFASDTDVAIWIAGAKRAYDVCRSRLDAIADFYVANKHQYEN